MPTSQSDTESVASPTAALKRDLEGVEAQLRGLADRWARVEAGMLRITCEETFLRRQLASSPLNTVRMPTRSSAAVRWELPPARRRQVFMFRDPTILFLVGLTNLIVSLFWGVTPCAPDFFPGDHQASGPLVKAQAPGTPDLAARAGLVPGHFG